MLILLVYLWSALLDYPGHCFFPSPPFTDETPFLAPWDEGYFLVESFCTVECEMNSMNYIQMTTANLSPVVIAKIQWYTDFTEDRDFLSLDTLSSHFLSEIKAGWICRKENILQIHFFCQKGAYFLLHAFVVMMKLYSCCKNLVTCGKNVVEHCIAHQVHLKMKFLYIFSSCHAHSIAHLWWWWRWSLWQWGGETFFLCFWGGGIRITSHYVLWSFF